MIQLLKSITTPCVQFFTFLGMVLLSQACQKDPLDAIQPQNALTKEETTH